MKAKGYRLRKGGDLRNGEGSASTCYASVFGIYLFYKAAFDLRKGAPMKDFFFKSRYYFNGPGAVGIFILRVFLGYAMAMHGLSKIQNPFGWMQGADVPGFLQALAAIAEFFGGMAILFGFLTPLACLGVMCVMFVAVLSTMLKGDAGFISGPEVKNSYELAAMYFLFALTLFLTGPGLLSVDAGLTKLMGKRNAATASP